MYLRRLHFLHKKLGKFILAFEETDNLLKRYKHEYLLLKKFTRGVNGGFGVAARRDKNPVSFCTSHKPDKVLGNLSFIYSIGQPFHFNEIERALQFDHAIDLLDDTFAGVSNKMKRFMNKNFVCPKQAIKSGLQLLSALLCRISRFKQSEEFFFRSLDLGDSFLLLASNMLFFGETLFALLLPLQIYASKRVFLINNLAYASNESLGFHLVIWPARIEVREFDDTPQHLAPFPKRCIPAPVQPL